MTQNKLHQREESAKDLRDTNSRRIEQLVDVVEKHTRTERHLEQYSDICSPDNIENAEKIQKLREAEISNLKNIISYGVHENSQEEYDIHSDFDD